MLRRGIADNLARIAFVPTDALARLRHKGVHYPAFNFVHCRYSAGSRARLRGRRDYGSPLAVADHCQWQCDPD